MFFVEFSSCPNCGERFKTHQQLKMHMNSCQAPPNKTCQHCSRTFSSILCYQKHVKICAGKFDITYLYFIDLIDTHLIINSHVSLRV